MTTQIIRSFEMPKRIELMKAKRNIIYHFILVLISISLTKFSSGQIIDSSRIASAEIKTFQSKVLGENRTIFIQTPSRMKPTDQYPVLYLLDGESFIEMAGGQVKYLTESYKIIPSLIIVGIKSTDRFKDLTPTHSIIGADGKRDTNKYSPYPTSGGGDKFLEFLREELFPYIEKNYPVAPYRILAGHSLGGLLAIHSFINQPNLFNAYIAISPSLQWDQEVILKMAAEKLSNQNSYNKILFFSDANEGELFHRNQLSLDSIFKQKKIAGLNFKYIHYPEESHISEPVKAFYDGIRHIYPNWHLPYNSSAFRKKMTSTIVLDHYKELSKIYRYNVLPPQDEINSIGRFLANDPARIKDAIELLEINARNYPNAVPIYDYLGDTYLKAHDTKKAITSYEKALALQPRNNSVKQKLQKLKNSISLLYLCFYVSMW
jgi:predicted alpha/beta superfamily hydrolase